MRRNRLRVVRVALVLAAMSAPGWAAASAAGSASSAPAVRPAELWSSATGSLHVAGILGNASVPWSPELRELTVMLDEPRAASAFSRSVGKLGRFPRVIIDDAPDGERYELDRAVVIRYAHQAPSTIRVTFRFARFRLRCGPPTCAIPLTYDSAAPR